MTSALFRHMGLLFLCILLTIGMVPAPAAAQSDAPTFVDAMDGGESALLGTFPLDGSQVVLQYAFGQFQIQAFAPTFAGDLFSYIAAGTLSDSRTVVDAFHLRCPARP